MDILDKDNIFCIRAGWNLARALSYARKYAEAEDILEGILEILPEQDCKFSFTRNTTLYNLARNYANSSRSEKAECLYRQVLAFYSLNKPFSYNSINLAKVWFGVFLMGEKRTVEAAEVFAEALSTAKDVWPEFPKFTHGDLVCVKLAAAYKMLGKYEEAKSVLLVTLSWFEEAYGPEDDWVFIILRYLGGAYADLGQLDKAEHQYRKILVGKKESPPFEDDRWAVHQLLADVLRRQKKFRSAEELCCQTLQERKRSLGPAYRDNSETEFNVGLIREDENLHEEAEKFYRDAFHGRKRHVKDRTDLKLLKYTLALGNIARIRGRYAEANTLLTEVTALFEQVLGVDHRDTLHSKHLLSLSLIASKQYAQAENMSREVSQGRVKLLGCNARPTVDAFLVLASTLHFQGRNQDAEIIYKENLMILEQQVGEDNIELLVPSLYRSKNLILMQEYKTADEILHRWLRVAEMSFGQTHEITFGVLFEVIKCFLVQGNYGAVERFCERYCTGMYEILKVGPKSLEASDGLYFLGLSYALQIPPKLELAVSTFQRCVDQRNLGLEPGHSATLIATLCLAMVNEELGKPSQAAELLPEAIKRLLTSTPRPGKSLLIKAFKQQGEALWSSGRYDLARIACQYSLAAWLECERSDPPIALFIHADLPRAYTIAVLERHYHREPEPLVAMKSELQISGHFRRCDGC